MARARGACDQREGGVRKAFNKTHGVPADDADRIALA